MRFCESQNLFLLAEWDVGEDCKAGVAFFSEDASLTVLFLHFLMEFSSWWIMFLDHPHKMSSFALWLHLLAFQYEAEEWV